MPNTLDRSGSGGIMRSMSERRQRILKLVVAISIVGSALYLVPRILAGIAAA
jgi:hypothetical protein